MREKRAHPPQSILVHVNGKAIRIPAGAMISAALLTAGVPSRFSLTGEPRTALCGMGICYECRAIVDGVPHQRTCQIACRPGMHVETQQ